MQDYKKKYTGCANRGKGNYNCNYHGNNIFDTTATTKVFLLCTQKTTQMENCQKLFPIKSTSAKSESETHRQHQLLRKYRMK